MKTQRLCHLNSGSRLHSRRDENAFSLVEVVIAIGIFGFCLLTLIALIPVGLTDNKSSRDRTIVADLCSSIESDLRSTPTTATVSPINGIKFPTPTGSSSASNTTTLYDTYSSTTTTFSTTRTASSQYCFTIILTAAPTNTNPNDPVIANILATWPAQASPSTANGAVNLSVAINRF